MFESGSPLSGEPVQTVGVDGSSALYIIGMFLYIIVYNGPILVLQGSRTSLFHRKFVLARRQPEVGLRTTVSSSLDEIPVGDGASMALLHTELWALRAHCRGFGTDRRRWRLSGEWSVRYYRADWNVSGQWWFSVSLVDSYLS